MNRIKVSQIETCEVGDIVSTEVVIKELREIDTTGRNYSQTMVTVMDRTGETTFPIWLAKDNVEDELAEGYMYRLHSNITLHNEANQLKYISAVMIEDNVVNRKKIDPSFSQGITSENEKVLLEVIENRFKDERYKRYAEVLLGLGQAPEGTDSDEYAQRLERFKLSWASIDTHDSYEGGLWNHVVGLIRLYISVKKQYEIPVGRQETKSEINWDYILLLCIAHDIEVSSEHRVEDKKCYINTDTQLNHIINGVCRIDAIHNQVEKQYRFNHGEIEDLKYGILCHQGDYEIKTLEDKIFNAIDTIDKASVEALRLE